MASDVKLINVFNGLFLYTEEEELIDLWSKNVELDVLEKSRMHSRNEFLTGVAFAHKYMLSLSQLQILNFYVSQNGRLIDRWPIMSKTFFSMHHIIEELTLTMLDAKLSPNDKIRLFAPEMESLLKQYKNDVTNNCVDHERLQIDSDNLYYSDFKVWLLRYIECMTTLRPFTTNYDENIVLANCGNNKL